VTKTLKVFGGCSLFLLIIAFCYESPPLHEYHLTTYRKVKGLSEPKKCVHGREGKTNIVVQIAIKYSDGKYYNTII